MRLLPLILLALGLGLLPGRATAANNVEFGFQGRAFSAGQPITGSAWIKFALVNAGGTVSIWSNDETSVAGSQPAASIPITVSNGVFDVMVGDGGLGMQPINGALFNGRSDLRLRIWLSDGVNGFQQLTPDRRIPNAELIGLRRSTENLTVYVNAATGNDANSGLAGNRAKRTIQAAVDMIPRTIGAGNARIDVANGIYRESVRLEGILVENGATFTLEGDEASTVSATSDPGVRITGTDNDTTHARVRQRGISINGCSGLRIVGFRVDYCTGFGVSVEGSVVALEKIKTTHNVVHGTQLIDCANSSLRQFWSLNNNNDGIRVIATNNLAVENCGAQSNGGNGLHIEQNSYALFSGLGNFSSNASAGIRLSGHSGATLVTGFSGTCNSNGNYGMNVNLQSFTTGTGSVTGTGNAGGATIYANGSAAY